MRHSKLELFYKDYLLTEKSADFISAVSTHYTICTLQKLATDGERVSRRASVLALGFLGDYRSNRTLGRALLDNDRAVRLLAEHGIRQLWFRVPKPQIANSLRKLSRQNLQKRYSATVELASRLVQIHPEIAEAWNQRAIALFAQGDYWHSVCDCREALDLNPHHFVAATGMANCYLQLNDGQSALDSFRIALSINPDLDRVRMQISRLEKVLEES